jgi:hypothetical protein
VKERDDDPFLGLRNTCGREGRIAKFAFIPSLYKLEFPLQAGTLG